MMLEILAWIVFGFTGLQFLVALANLIFRERMHNGSQVQETLVSVLIPARNEEVNLPGLLNDIIRQQHQHTEVIVFDDQSTDRTAKIVEDFARKDPRIRLIRSKGLPEGWLGKNHACHQLASAASGQYLLFLDADVHIAGDLIPASIAHMEKHSLALISIFPRQIMKTAGEWAGVPVMNYILLSLLPLALVRHSPRPSLSAANGQFMFFRAREYHSVQPHSLFRSTAVEDIAISRHLKSEGHSISCQSGDRRIRCRMYRGYAETISGFTKNVLDFFGGSFILALLFWSITSLGFLAVIACMNPPLVIAFFSIYLLTRIAISLQSRQNILLNILFIIPQQISMGIFIFRAIIKKDLQWKGRSI